MNWMSMFRFPPRVARFALSGPCRPLHPIQKRPARSCCFPLPPFHKASLSTTRMAQDPFRPAQRVAGARADVWSIVNEAASSSPIQPIINMGQGFFGYNPPKFVIDAAKSVFDRVDANQYAPTKGRPRLKKAIANAYSPFFGRELDSDKNVVITTGANEGMLSVFMGFLGHGDEAIVFEPFFDQYISNIEMSGGKPVYVPMMPPSRGATEKNSASEWKIDMAAFAKAITSRTRMIVLNSPHNPVGKVFSKDEIIEIGEICAKHNLIILSDEVYDRLYYTQDRFARIAALSEDFWNRTISVCSGGKMFYATGWRVGWLIGPDHLIKHAARAHTQICYSSVSPLQEAMAIGLEEADKHNFFEESRREMKGKMDRFNEVWDELGLPYSEPEGGYFVLVNMAKVKLPADLEYPSYVSSRPRDFQLMWFLIFKIGVAAIPPSEFFTPENEHLVKDYLRFAVCKEDEVLEKAKERLRALKEYID